MSLSCDEARAVAPIAWSLPTPAHSIAFLREVEAALAGHPARGEGFAHRVAAEILPRYFVPPPIPLRAPQEHYNVRQPWLRRRA
jgi:hypothetical protein